MNHLAHFKVAHPDANLMIGGLLGDFVKGRLKGEFPEAIERGIRLHRAVDAYADNHPVVRQSIGRFAPRFRRFGPIMVDVIYDHFLAREWQLFCDDSLSGFVDAVLGVLNDELSEVDVPAKARNLVAGMTRSRSLEGYGNEQYVDRSFTHLSTRLRRENPLGEGFPEFKGHEEELYADFALFFPDLLAFSRNWRLVH